MATTVEQQHWGTVDGEPIWRFVLENETGARCALTSYGAAVTELWVPDRAGAIADVVLGFDTVEGYRADRAYLGTIVGPVANRIADASFELMGRTVKLEANDGPHHLHGASAGWHKVCWSAECSGDSVRMSYTQTDGAGGYPGPVHAVLVYSFLSPCTLVLEIEVSAKVPTLVNPAHHGYFNLAGHDLGPVLDQELQLFAERRLETRPDLIPTGAMIPVAATPYDFLRGRRLGTEMERLVTRPPGYDTTFVLADAPGRLREAARLFDPGSGRLLDVWTTAPAVHVYTGNFLDGSLVGKGGTRYGRHGGVCFETQGFPDAIHHAPWREQVLSTPARPYRQRVEYRFSSPPRPAGSFTGVVTTERAVERGASRTPGK